MRAHICRLKVVLACLCWGGWSILSWASLAPDTPYSGWLDLHGASTIETVQQEADWQSATGWRGWSYGPEPVWLRVNAPAVDSADAQPLVLIVRPPHLDQVTFYDPTFGVQRKAGDHFRATEDALHTVLFTFEVQAHPVPRDVFVKVQSSSARVVHLSLLPWPEAQVYTRSVEWITGFVWVLSLVFLFWALILWWCTRERIMGIFAIKQACITLWGFLFLGFARLSIGSMFAEGVLSLISSMVISGVVASSIWFLTALLQDYQARPWMLRVLRVSALLIACLGLLNLVGRSQQSLQIINTAVPPLLLWVFLTLLMTTKHVQMPPASKTFLMFYLAVYGILNSLPALIHTGFIKESSILFFGNMSLLVLDGLIMLVILNVRQRRFQEQHQAVKTQLVLQQEQARLDRQYLDEQRKLLAVLAHEMKTPLANLRIWMEAGPKGRPIMERAISDMDRVIERCVHAGQLSDNSLKPHNEWLDAAELTLNLISASREPGRLQLQLPTDVCPIFTDAQMLSIVLSNVLENAYKYSPPGSPIMLRMFSQSSSGETPGWCWVVDNTVGDSALPDPIKVFDKYYRGAKVQRQSGSGLGLFLVKALLELMQGYVTYSPSVDRVRFMVWIPVQPR